MQNAKNAHADLGYRDDLIDPAAALHMVERLKAEQPVREAYKRVMYGTDWIMLEKLVDWQEYSDKLYFNFKKIDENIVDSVFYENASRLFNLSP